MESTMHGSFDRSGTRNRTFLERWGIGFPAFPVLLAVALIGLAILEPAASKWISEATQAELAGIYVVPQTTPTQLARPSMEVRTVRIY
jgi:hypothetical protein